MVRSKIFSFISFFLSVLVGYNAYCQHSVSPAIRISEQTPKSPQVASLGKYIDFPVNMATGLPQISIPIFTIKQGDITLPIVLNYHSGGVKVNESASWVGMNWSLSYGVGVLTKKVNGLDDFCAATAASGSNVHQIYLNPDYSQDNLAGYSMTDVIDAVNGSGNWSINHAVDFRRLTIRIAKGYIDGEADEYFVSTPEGSGRFFYNQKTRRFEFDRYTKWKAIYGGVEDGNYDNGEHGLFSWVVTTSNGTKYEFGKTELYSNPLWIKPPGETGIQPRQELLTNSWHITKITDPKTTKEILFEYNTVWLTSRSGIYSYRDYINYYNYVFHGFDADEVKRTGHESVISKITFDQGSIHFIQDSDPRQDGGVKALKEVHVYNSKGQLIKKVVLNYFYNTGTSNTCVYPVIFDNNYPYPNNAICDTLVKRMFLDNVSEYISDQNGAIKQLPAYKFKYDFTKQLPARFSFAQDLWGSPNGKIANTTYLPTIPANAYPGVPMFADRSVDVAFSKSGILNEITYPTGGKAQFEYEGNTLPTQEQIGGLRIKKITNIDPVQQQQLVSEYEYTYDNGVSSGEVLNRPLYYYEMYKFSDGGSDGRIVRIESDALVGLSPVLNSPVLYRQVTKKRKSAADEIVSKHYFTGYNTGEFFEIYPDNYTNYASVPKPKQTKLDDFIGLEYMTEAFKKTGNTVSLVQKTENHYSALNPFNNYIWNVQAAASHPHFFEPFIVEWPSNDPFSRNPPNIAATINAYKIYKNQAVVTSQKETIVEGNTQTVQQSFIGYDKATGNRIITRKANSKGDTIINVVKFNSQYTVYENSVHTWNTVLDNLSYQNITTFPVESAEFIKYKNSTDSLLTGATLYEYEGLVLKKVYKITTEKPVGGFQFSTNTPSSFVFDSRYKLETEVNEYDLLGNPLTVTNVGNASAFIWDTKSDIIIGTVANATNKDVAYSSFEIENKGNWNFAALPIRDAAITGNYVYPLSSGIISTVNTLNPNKEYCLTVWIKSGSGNCLVNGITPTSILYRNGFWLNKVTLPTNTTSVQISGTGIIDELRLYPVTSQMTTFTYEPLFGITSKNDVNNNIIYYEYDGMDRLVLIKNSDGNIVKRICYNYAGQPDNCSDAPSWQLTGNSRCKPCPLNNTYTTNILQNEVKDLNPNSVTYNQVQWVDAGTSSNCGIAVWENQGAPFCETSNGENTGNQLQTQKDSNPCSGTYNQFRTILLGYNPAACTLPSSCNIYNCNQEGYKCVNGNCELGYRVNTASWYDWESGMVICVYHYEWSDGTWSGDYMEYGNGFCPIL